LTAGNKEYGSGASKQLIKQAPEQSFDLCTLFIVLFDPEDNFLTETKKTRKKQTPAKTPNKKAARRSAEQGYTAEKIKVMEGLEAVRKRPAMYIGNTHSEGLHHLVYEVVDNSIDEAMGGYCDRVSVTIRVDNSIVVEDNGRGIPVDRHKKMKKSAAEVVIPRFTQVENSKVRHIKSRAVCMV
jgi:hypothetical protein